jgi:hypothetical protein
MRQGQQHRRGRSRGSSGGNGSHTNHGSHNQRKGQNPLSRSFESNGPDVKVRGTAADVASKYMTLARDAQTSGDPVLAENYLQHAEHYNRLIITYREQQILQGGDATGPNGHRMRTVNEYGEPADSDDEPADPGMADQPPMPIFSRQPGQDGQPRPDSRQDARPDTRHENGRHDERRSHDERRPQDDRRPQHGRQQDQRHDRGGDNPRFRDRRFDRGERSDRGDRQDRPDRGDRPERSERPERPEYRGEPNDSPPIDRPTRSPPPVVDQPQPAVVEAVEPAAREPAPSRRRERFDMMKDQPEFLRRPVRRPRREEAAPDTADDAPAASGEPQEKPGS